MNKLHMAALTGDLPGLRDAVESGIDINSVEPAHGNTPLMLAAYNNHPALVAWLIARGAVIDARCKESNTALMKAAWSGATACVAALIEASSFSGVCYTLLD